MQKAMAWKVAPGARPKAIESASIDLERHLEEWIESDHRIAAEDILVIGRQLATSWGTHLDLLGIDSNGDLVILELKRDQTLRETIAQAAAWASKLNYDEIWDLASSYFDFSRDRFAAAFRERFASEVPDELNAAQRIILVAPTVDAKATAVVEYLADTYQMPINAVYFDVFESEGDERLLVRLTVVDEQQGRPSPPRTKRAPSRTIEQLREMAIENNAVDAFDEILKLRELIPSLYCHQTSFNLRAKAQDTNTYVSAISVHPAREDVSDAVDVVLSRVNLERILGVSAPEVESFMEDLRGFLTENPEFWQGWGRFAVSGSADAQVFSAKFRDLWNRRVPQPAAQ